MARSNRKGMSREQEARLAFERTCIRKLICDTLSRSPDARRVFAGLLAGVDAGTVPGNALAARKDLAEDETPPALGATVATLYALADRTGGAARVAALAIVQKHRLSLEGLRLLIERLEPGSNEAATLNRVHLRWLAGRNEIAAANLGLVPWVIQHHRLHGLDEDDLLQEGNAGLLRAAELYEPGLGNKFSTYATFWIRQAIGRAIANDGCLIRVPAHLHADLARVRRAIRKLDVDGEFPVAQLAAELGEKVSWVESRLPVLATQKVASFDTPTSEGDTTLGELLADHGAVDPQLVLEQVDEAWILRRFLATLRPREEQVLRLRTGMTTDGEHTLEAIGERYEVTRERIRQIEKGAKETLKRRLEVSDLEEARAAEGSTQLRAQLQELNAEKRAARARQQVA